MKKYIALLLFITSFSIAGNAQTTKEINLQQSTIIWEGSKLFGFGIHDGSLKFKEGRLITKNNTIIGGEFIVDMHSMKSNEEETWTANLVEHLKGKDFFNVEVNPTAKLVFSEIENVGNGYTQITADLTINGFTKSVFFVAKSNNDQTQIETRLKIDRTEWDITYKSQGITSIKDQIISDAISLDVIITL